jgi:phthalate 4,5-dioxygenase oxygenase subunit
MRRYWQPAALSEELPPGGPPMPLRLFGEDLVLFRDDQGRVGLLGLHCAHRGMDLSYGRVEDGGLRCLYHGWLYDVHGNCIETPGEPLGSRLCEGVRQRAYPCQEVGDVIFMYMGPGEAPLLPNYELLHVASEHRFATKIYLECNYLQALEGNMDSVHVQFLHRRLGRDRDERSRWRPKDNYVGPRRTEESDFGIWSYRPDQSGKLFGGPDFIFPSLCLTGGGFAEPGDGYAINWRVPLDDTSHWLFRLRFIRSRPVSQKDRDDYAKLLTPDYKLTRNRSNRYLQDREEQRTSTYAGMGRLNVVDDAAANETQGRIQDRTQEYLGEGDRSIIAARKMLLRAIQTVKEGGEPPGIIRDPEVNKLDPIFLKRNAPPKEQEAEEIFAETGQRWVKSVVKS